MDELRFDPTLTPQENIELFFQHLDSINPPLTTLLRANIGLLSPFPEANAQRSVAREKFNQAIASKLDELIAVHRGTSA